MKGFVTTTEEFLYPDTKVDILPESCKVCMAKNGKKGIQLLLDTEGKDVTLSLHIDHISVNWYQLKAIPVEFNTGDGVSQGGSMVLDTWSDSMSDYVTRRAPFEVYDCLIPLKNGNITGTEKRKGVYICLEGTEDTVPGVVTGVLKIQGEGISHEIQITVSVYDVEIPEDTFKISNWFSMEAIERFHGSEYFYEMLTKYIRTMKRTHQTAFFLELTDQCVKDREKIEFDFEYLTPVIELFKKEGIHTLEIGKIFGRGVLPDGTPDMYTHSFVCEMYPDVHGDTPEGMKISEKFVESLAKYLKLHGWDQELLFHIHDEPDIHYKNEEALKNRKEQYHMARQLVKKYLPKAQIIEAVGTSRFVEDIDVMVPVTSCYEEQKGCFDGAIKEGKELWNYVCCGPEGKWLNRFLDIALIKGRILFWGFAKNNISGYLHWGFNRFPEQMNPFEGTSCYNSTGIGTNFPCGDAFIVYPGDDGPWLSMRLEAQRQGAEDVMLLQMLQKRNPEKTKKLIDKVFTSNTVYNEDAKAFQETYEELLQSLVADKNN